MRYAITVPDRNISTGIFPAAPPVPSTRSAGVTSRPSGFRKMRRLPPGAGAKPVRLRAGRICAHPCEDACRRGKIDEPIAICALKRYATERHNLGAGHDPARKKLPPAPKRGKRIAIVGAGVCGLTCAHDLALLGYTVEVFESAPVPAGCSIWASRTFASLGKSSRWRSTTSCRWTSRCTPA